MIYRTDELNNGKESVGPLDETFFEYKSFVVEYTVFDDRNVIIILMKIIMHIKKLMYEKHNIGVLIKFQD